LVADASGHIVYKKNGRNKFIPASTLKLLTALAAIHQLGRSYRFQTEFYTRPDQGLIVKGYGDPLLISEVLQEIADVLAKRMHNFRDLVLDDDYFSHRIRIPSVGGSTNPYDAPVGALCANFNTVFFDRDQQGRIISAELQTPLIPFSLNKIHSLGLKNGRYTFTHDRKEATLYLGNLLSCFLKERGVKSHGRIRLGSVKPGDRLIYTYTSRFTLEQSIKKMMEFSNNFIANQVFITLGAKEYGPPGTLAKGIRVVSDYAKNELHLKDLNIVEGSGISRQNRISYMDMLTVLRNFSPYRHLLKRKDNVLYKTGTLRGIRTLAGFLEGPREGPYCFIISLREASPDTDALLEYMKCSLAHRAK